MRESDLPPLLAARIVVALAVATTLAVVVSLLTFAHPMGDDFCNAVAAREHGVLGAVRHEYLSWGGRWASHVIVVGFPALADPTRTYPLALACVLAVNLLALRCLLGVVAPLGGTSRRAWTLALVLFALQLAGLPAPGQTVYWFEGAAVYSLSVSLGVLVVAGLLRLPRRASARRGLAVAGLTLLALGTAAFHELFALVLTAVLATGAALAFAMRDPRRLAWGAAAAAALAGLLSVVLAPGNELREAHIDAAARSPAAALVAALAMWLRVLDAPASGDPIGFHVPLGWLVDARLLAASVLVATSAPEPPEWLRDRARLWRVLAPAATFGLLSAAFLAGGFAPRGMLPLRAFNGLYLVFLLGWFLTILVHADGRRDALGASPRAIRVLRVGSAGILALGLLVSGNVKHGLRDLARGRAAAFDRAMEQRYAEARRVREAGAGELVLAPIEPWPSTYFRNDVGRQKPTTRACVARYFEVGSVRIEATPAP